MDRFTTKHARDVELFDRVRTAGDFRLQVVSKLIDLVEDRVVLTFAENVAPTTHSYALDEHVEVLAS